MRSPSVSRSRSNRHVGELAHDLGDLLVRHFGAPAATRARAGEVDHADRLVGQRAPGQVPHAPRDARGERLLRVARRVVLRERRRDLLEREVRRLGDSSTTSIGVKRRDERRVGVDRALVLFDRRRADARQLAARERDFQLGRRLFAGFAAEERVHLVEEHDDAPLRALHPFGSR